jgi:hypothetical protein
MFEFNFQTRNKTRLHDSKQEHKMCKTNVKTDFYYTNTCKHEHEKNMTRLWCKIVPKTNVEHTKGNEWPYSYLYPFWDIVQGSFKGGFYVCIKKKTFLKTFLTESQL